MKGTLSSSEKSYLSSKVANGSPHWVSQLRQTLISLNSFPLETCIPCTNATQVLQMPFIGTPLKLMAFDDHLTMWPSPSGQVPTSLPREALLLLPKSLSHNQDLN